MILRPKVLTIDFWGTLFLDTANTTHHEVLRRNAYDAYLQDAGYRGASDVAEDFYVTVERVVKSVWAADHPPTHDAIIQRAFRAWRGRIRRSVLEGLLELTYELYTHELLPESTAGAVDFVKWASDQWPLYLISDTYVLPGRILDQILKERQLYNSFRGRLYSDELGVRKPDPSTIKFVAKQEGISTGEIVHIGDSIETDGQLASKAASQFVHVLFDKRPQSEAALQQSTLLAHCRSFEEVSKLLRRLDGDSASS